MRVNKTWLMGGVAAAAIAVGAAGMLTNGLPTVTVGATNYTQLAPGQLNSGLGTAEVTNCCGPLVPVDTNRTGGAAPQSVAATPFQVAGTLGDAINSTQTSTVHAATSNTLGGVVVTEALTTAPGANYTFTLTDSVLTAAYAATGATPQVAIYSISNTGGVVANRYTAHMTLVSQTLATGSVTWVWRNDGNTALNGTMMIVWHV